MEFRLLEYFLAVAREQNITAAAESLLSLNKGQQRIRFPNCGKAVFILTQGIALVKHQRQLCSGSS